MRIKYPRPSVRRARADASVAQWATPSNELDNVQEAQYRGRMDWLAGYESCMRDVQKQLKGKR